MGSLPQTVKLCAYDLIIENSTECLRSFHFEQLHSLITNVAIESIVCGDRHICSTFTIKADAVFMFVWWFVYFISFVRM